MAESSLASVRHPSSPDHRADGKFAPGNRAGVARGNPHADKVAVWRRELVEAMKPNDIRDVMAKLIEVAKSGEGWAIRELLDRTVGPTGKIDIAAMDGGAIQINFNLASDEGKRTSTPPPVDANPCDIIEIKQDENAGQRVGQQNGSAEGVADV